LLVGALRDPAPIGDVVQEFLSDDSLVIVARPAHPLMARTDLALTDLAAYPFVVSTEGTPTRAAFDRPFRAAQVAPVSLVETGSMILMRELLQRTDNIGCISGLQVQAEVASGAFWIVPLPLGQTAHPIGMTRRAGWLPTKAQQEFIDAVRATLRDEAPRPLTPNLWAEMMTRATVPKDAVDPLSSTNRVGDSRSKGRRRGRSA
jgi:LysR family transcriptional regulator, regulator for genes of the gallate degradation pathway